MYLLQKTPYLDCASQKNQHILKGLSVSVSLYEKLGSDPGAAALLTSKSPPLPFVRSEVCDTLDASCIRSLCYIDLTASHCRRHWARSIYECDQDQRGGATSALVRDRQTDSQTARQTDTSAHWVGHTRKSNAPNPSLRRWQVARRCVNLATQRLQRMQPVTHPVMTQRLNSGAEQDASNKQKLTTPTQLTDASGVKPAQTLSEAANGIVTTATTQRKELHTSGRHKPKNLGPFLGYGALDARRGATLCCAMLLSHWTRQTSVRPSQQESWSTGLLSFLRDQIITGLRRRET